MYRSQHRNDRICAKCVEEDDLEEYIVKADGEPGCSFCGCDDAPTCSFLDFMDHVRTCVEDAYDLAANCLAFESAEGGYLWDDLWDTSELLTDHLGIGLPRDNDGNLLEAMVDCLGGLETWCDKDPYGEDPISALLGGWDKFCHVIKHHTRFFLDRWSEPKSKYIAGDSPTPGQMLTGIGDGINRLSLYDTLHAGACIYRVRYCPRGKRWDTPGQLGPPPADRSFVTNRMSPPGIVMFYGARDAETALAETVKERGVYAIATFRVRRDVWLLDLTKVPQPQRFFEPIPDYQAWSRVDAEFFHNLVADFTRPIERDDRVHIEYIPTQVFTEYCRLAFHHEYKDEIGGKQLEGILYPSARNPGHAAVVLFADRSVVAGVEPIRNGEPDNTWLEMTGVEYRTY